MFPLLITLKSLPRMTNNSRSHWTKIYRERKKWKHKVTLALVDLGYFKAKPEVLKKAKITLTRYSSSRPDFDGLVSGFKAVIDSLVENDVIEDDKFDVIGDPKYEWAKAKPGGGYITVLIEEIDKEREQDEATGSSHA